LVEYVPILPAYVEAMVHTYFRGGRLQSGSATIQPVPPEKLPQPLGGLTGSGLHSRPSHTASDNISYRQDKIHIVILLLLFSTFFFGSFLFSVADSLQPQILPASAAAEETEVRLPPALVTEETLQAKIDEIDSAVDLTEDEKKELLELYRKSMSNLQSIKSNLETTAVFRKETKAAPEQMESIKADIAELERQLQATKDGRGEDIGGQVDELVQLLQTQQAELAAANAAKTDIVRRLSYMGARPVAISKRLAEAEQEQDEMEAGLKLSASEVTGNLAQARRWVFETGFMARSTEIAMLNEELLRKPLRTSLLETRLQRHEANIKLLNIQVDRINERLNRERLLEAEQVQRQAEKVEQEAKGGNPVLVKLSAENAELTKDINEMAGQLESLSREYEQALKLNTRVAANFQDAQDTLKSSGLTEGLGKVLLAQQSYLPELEDKGDEVRARDAEIAEVEVLRLRLQAEARRMADPKLFMNHLVEEARWEKSEALFAELRPQVALRTELVTKAMDMIELYLSGLTQLNEEERKLLASVTDYREFLQQNLLWLRNAEPTKPSDFLKLPQEVRELYRVMIRASFVAVVKSHLIKKPVFWLVIGFALYLTFRRRTIVGVIKERAKIVGRPITDSFTNTFTVGLLTALLVAPVPLVLTVTGWLLESAGENELVTGLGQSLLNISLYFFCLRFFRAVCIPRGLAEVHFRWPKDKLDFLGKELDRFFVVIIPTSLLVLLAVSLQQEDEFGILARLSFLIANLALIVFLYRILHPAKGVLSHLREQESTTRIVSSYPILFFLLILFPISLVILAFSGYTYSVGVVSSMFGHTLLLILALVILKSLLLRWLEVVRRKMNYETLCEKRRERLEEQEETDEEGGDEEAAAMLFEEPEVDVAALTGETREFVTLAVFLTGLFGLYLIWSAFLPALKIFDEVVLWHNTVKEAGVEKRLPITLADLGLGIIYGVTIFIVAKRLPSLLEIILLRRTNMSSGDRYTLTSLANYTVIAFGVVLVLNTIGAQWSQLQWLVAALGVGIGFGLQEIIANFMSGLIILFEQPVRVGDIVTIGGTDGVVTKIRIRATTIRNWDRKELLVPNKEFITGRLLNWSLDDQVTRIYLVIGIAYGSDVDLAMELIRQAAEKQEHVLEDPPPHVNFEGFGDNSLNLTLRAYIDNIDCRLSTITDIHLEINRLFGQADIPIPFPQRDVHLDSQRPLRVQLETS